MNINYTDKGDSTQFWMDNAAVFIRKSSNLKMNALVRLFVDDTKWKLTHTEQDRNYLSHLKPTDQSYIMI